MNHRHQQNIYTETSAVHTVSVMVSGKGEPEFTLYVCVCVSHLDPHTLSAQ